MIFEGQWYGDMPPAAVVLDLVSDKTISFKPKSYHIYTNITKTYLKILDKPYSLTKTLYPQYETGNDKCRCSCSCIGVYRR